MANVAAYLVFVIPMVFAVVATAYAVITELRDRRKGEE